MPAAPVQDKQEWKQFGFGTVLFFLICFTVYWPALHGDYLWDDEVMLTENRLVQQNDGLKSIWFSTKPHDYFPLTYTSFWLEWHWSKLNPFSYHATNVALHALSAVLLWRVLQRLKIPGAAFAGLIFAVHPVCVPSVAWITERKNTLSMVFYLLTILFFLRSLETKPPDSKSKAQNSKFYLLSLGSFLLALLAKTSVVMLPFVLLGCVWWRIGKIEKRDLLRAIPFFALSLILGLITIWFQNHRAIGTQITDPFPIRSLGGGRAIWFYLSKAILPLNLVMIYPRWQIFPASPLAWFPWMAWLGLLFACWKFRQSWGRPALFALGYFFITLAPVLGVFDMSFFAHSRVADHLQYLSIIGIIALAVGTAVHISPKLSAPISAALFLIAAGLAVVSWNRARVFASSENLWRDNVKKNPAAWGAHNNLGLAAARRGDVAEAIEHYRASIKARPDYANAHNNLGLALHGQKKYAEAIEHYSGALQSEPKFAEVHNNIANSLAALGRLDEAVSHYQIALQLKPDFTFAHNNYAFALARLQRYDEAASHFEMALKLSPNYALARNNFGLTLYQQRKYAEAIAQFREALRLDSTLADAHCNLANALSDSGKLEEAIPEFQAALRLKPNHTEICNSLGVAFAMKGDLGEAIHYFGEAVRLQPTNSSSLNNLAHAFAQQGKFEEAVKNYETLLRLNATEAETHFDLGVALARLGQNEKATSHFREALRLKPNHTEAQKQLQAIQQRPSGASRL